MTNRYRGRRTFFSHSTFECQVWFADVRFATYAHSPAYPTTNFYPFASDTETFVFVFIVTWSIVVRGREQKAIRASDTSTLFDRFSFAFSYTPRVANF